MADIARALRLPRGTVRNHPSPAISETRAHISLIPEVPRLGEANGRPCPCHRPADRDREPS